MKWTTILGMLTAFVAGVAVTKLWLAPAPLQVNPSSLAQHPAQIPAEQRIQSILPLQTQAHIAPLTLAEVNARRSDFEQTLGLYELMRDMGPEALLALLDEASLISGADYVAATSIIIGRLAELDADLALETALTTTTLAQPAWIRAIFASWSRIDGNAAHAGLQSLPPGLRAVAQQGMARANGSRQMVGVADTATVGGAIMVTPTGTPFGVDALTDALPMDTDLQVAWQDALVLSNPQQRMFMLQRIASQWALSDPEAAMTATRALSEPVIARAVEQQIAMQWAQNDPAAAMRWISAQPPSQQNNLAIRVAAQSLAKQNFSEARMLVAGLPDGQREHAQLGLLPQWVEHDLSGAQAWVEAQDNRNVRMQAIQHVTLSLMQQDRQRATAWLSSLPAGDAAMASTMAVAMLANTDAQGAFDFIDTIEQPAARSNAAQQMVGVLGRSEPQRASRWIAEQNPDQRPQLYASLVRSWGGVAPREALTFAESIQDSEARDQALFALAPMLTGNAAERAFDQIQNAQLRAQLTQRMQMESVRR